MICFVNACQLKFQAVFFGLVTLIYIYYCWRTKKLSLSYYFLRDNKKLVKI